MVAAASSREAEYTRVCLAAMIQLPEMAPKGCCRLTVASWASWAPGPANRDLVDPLRNDVALHNVDHPEEVAVRPHFPKKIS